MNNSATYSLAMRLMHWLMAALVLSLVLAGLTMVSALGAWQQQLLTWHKMAGLVAACAVLLRIYLRLTTQVPVLPNSLPLWQQWAARLTHFAFYLLLVLMPLTGYLMQNAAGLPVVVFDMSLPMLLASDLARYGLLRELHGWTSLLLMLLIILHISAALQHGFIKCDGVLASMLKKSA